MNTSVNELVKTLFIEKTIAILDRYQNGELYYRFEVAGVRYEVSIPVINRAIIWDQEQLYSKASDVGATAFYSEMRASELMRWIKPAAMTEGLVKLTE